MRRTLYVLSLGLACLVGNAYAQVFNNNYYFSPTNLPNYSDVTTVKATEQVSSDELITVGYAKESANALRNDIVIVKTRISNGAVIWAKRYGVSGQEERAYGLTLDYGQQHVMVVGTAQNPETRIGNMDGFIMRVEISTGNVDWAANYGDAQLDQELRMIQRSVNGPAFPENFTYTAVGSTTLTNSKSTLYALAVDVGGFQQWSNIYLDLSSVTTVFDVAYTMVRNPFNKFIITGTRYEGSFPSRIFTVGIDPLSGSLSDRYIQYTIDNRDHFEGAICNVKSDNLSGYGLAFTTGKPEVEPGVDECISMILLDDIREPVLANHYWQSEHSTNKGLAIYQSGTAENTLDIYTSTVATTNNPGFLNIGLLGNVNYFLKYNVEEGDNKYPTAMVQTKFGYTAKALHRDAVDENGFMLAGLAPNGKTECAVEELMNWERQDVRFQYRAYASRVFGLRTERRIAVNEVLWKEETCDGQTIPEESSEKTASSFGETQPNTFSIYPNPLTGDQSDLRLQYTLEDAQQVEISIYNALGQQTLSQKTTLNGGPNQLSLDASALSVGVNFITVRHGSDVLFQSKVIKD